MLTFMGSTMPQKPCSALLRTGGVVHRLQASPRLTSVSSQQPGGLEPASSLQGELLGGRARPVGSHSCLMCRSPSSWAREPLQQAAVRLCKRLYTPGSFETGWVPSGNEVRATSELDKSCSGAGTSLNFSGSVFKGTH